MQYQQASGGERLPPLAFLLPTVQTSRKTRSDTCMVVAGYAAKELVALVLKPEELAILSADISE
jgi:hypothetical protein